MRLHTYFYLFALFLTFLTRDTDASSSCSPCLPSCRFRFCVNPHSLPIFSKPGETQPPAICDQNAYVIGAANSGPFYIYESDKLSSPTWFPRHSFKTLSLKNGSAAIFHEHLNPAQRLFVVGKCVVLTISSAQILDHNGRLKQNLNLDRNNPQVNCISFRATDGSESSSPQASVFSVAPSAFFSAPVVTATAVSSPAESETPDFEPSPIESESAQLVPSASTLEPEPSAIFPTPTSSSSASQSSPPPSGVIASEEPLPSPEQSMKTAPSTSSSAIPSSSVSGQFEEPGSEPTPSPDVDPDGTETELGPVDDFVSNSFRSSVPMEASQAVVESDDANFPGKYSYSFNGTIRSEGVISLNTVSSEISSITCHKNASIDIVFAPSFSKKIRKEDITSMFPDSALVVIESAKFGYCRLVADKDTAYSNDPDLGEIKDEFRARPFESFDGFLIIKSVKVGSSQQSVTLSGIPSTYASMFSDASVRLERLNESSSLVRDTNYRSDNNLTTLSRRVAPTIPLKYSFSLLSMTANVGPYAEGTLELFYAKWSTSTGQIDSELIFSLDYGFQATVEAKLSKGYSAPLKDVFFNDLLSIPIYGLKELPVLRRALNKVLSKVDTFELPSLKVGLFVEMPIIAELSASIDVDIIQKGTFSYSFGKRRLAAFISGPLWNISKGVRTLSSEPSGWNDPVLPQPIPIEDAKPFGKVKAFVGFRPQVVLYMLVLEARLSVKYGLKIDGEVNALSVFKPNTPPKVGIEFGHCETCHKARLTVSYFIGDYGFFLTKGSMIGERFLTDLLPSTILQFKLPATVGIDVPLIRACLWREFEEHTLTCGETCCDKRLIGNLCPFERSVGDGSSELCIIPTPSVSPKPKETFTARLYTDPHLVSFDGLRFSCQGSGEFIIARSAIYGTEIQARFDGENTTGSVTKGLVIRHKNSTLQFSIARNITTSPFGTTACPIVGFLDGKYISGMSSLDTQSTFTIKSLGRTYTVESENGVSITFIIFRSRTFGCYFEQFQVSIPAANDWTGLFGTPNGNVEDDWIAKNGTVLVVPQDSGTLFEPAYNYCTKNWCIRDMGQSLFSYEVGDTFDTFMQCDKPFQFPDLSSASAELRALCGTNAECLIDGLAGDISDARNTVRLQRNSSSFVPTNLTFSITPLPTPTVAPTIAPSLIPSANPSVLIPSLAPSADPSVFAPSTPPTSPPTLLPSITPSLSTLPSFSVQPSIDPIPSLSTPTAAPSYYWPVVSTVPDTYRYSAESGVGAGEPDIWRSIRMDFKFEGDKEDKIPDLYIFNFNFTEDYEAVSEKLIACDFSLLTKITGESRDSGTDGTKRAVFDSPRVNSGPFLYSQFFVDAYTGLSWTAKASYLGPNGEPLKLRVYGSYLLSNGTSVTVGLHTRDYINVCGYSESYYQCPVSVVSYTVQFDGNSTSALGASNFCNNNN